MGFDRILLRITIMNNQEENNISNGLKLMFSGGGTLGPVTPLLAIINEIKKNHPQDEIFWVSTFTGIENDFLKSKNIKIFQIHSAKLRRYISVYNFIDFFNFIRALFESYKIIKKINPDIIISVGGYVSVAPVIIGKILGKKVLIHQQDIRVGLANKLMKPFADIVTVTFQEQLKYFAKKAILTGNPCRFSEDEILNLSKEKILEKYNFSKNKQILLILGGSSGALNLNNKIYKSLDELLEKFQVIHSTGENKNQNIEKKDYYQYNFLDEKLLDFMFISDIVVSRAGMATLTELSMFSKCAIIAPLLGHQQDNAKYFYDKGAVDNSDLNNLTEKIFLLYENKDKRKQLEQNIKKIMPHDSVFKIIDIIYGFKKG